MGCVVDVCGGDGLGKEWDILIFVVNFMVSIVIQYARLAVGWTRTFCGKVGTFVS